MAKKKEENIEETRIEEKKEINKDEKEKINNIIAEAKQNGKMTYGDLSTKLNDVNPEKMDEVFY